MIPWAHVTKKISLLARGGEEKPAAWLTAFGVLYVIFFIIYFPLQRRYQTISTQLNLRNQDIKQAKASGLTDLNLNEIIRLQERVSRFKKSFIKISKAASVLDGISEAAEKYNIRVISIDSESPVSLKNDTGVDFVEGGMRYSRFPVRFHLQGDTRSLTDFLQELSNSETFYFVIDGYGIKKISPKSGLLDCELALSFFANG